MKLLKALSLLMAGTILLWSGYAYAEEPLPPAQAFQVTAKQVSAQKIETSWKIAPNYFIYADKVSFSLQPEVGFLPVLPTAVKKMDPVRGEVDVYSGDFTIPLNLNTQLSAAKLEVKYQGCSKAGFCYPPMTVTFEMNASSVEKNSAMNYIATNQSISELVTDQYGIQALLDSENRVWLLLIFLGLGILLAFTPCVLPMVPIITGIIAGQKGKLSTRKTFSLAATYVLGMSITYALAGMMAAYAGGSLQVWLQTPAVIIFSSLVFVFLAFSLFEFYELPISRRWQNAVSRWSSKHEGGTFVGVFFMGILSTLVVSPCVTAPLVGVLLYIGRTGDMLLGGSALFFMGIGMGLPLILLAMSAGHWLPKSGQWMHAVTKSFGLIMLGVAVWLLGRILPMSVMLILWGAYLVAIALFFSLYLTRVIGRKAINHTLGFATGLLGVLMILSTLGIPTIINKWTNEGEDTGALHFVVVHNQSELMDELQDAKSAGDPVLVDFYADWCSSCVDMNKRVFSEQNVQLALQPFKLIRVDLSQNSEEDQALLQAYHVVAPPTVIFFSASGDEVNSRRIVGEISAKDFLNRINLFMAENCDIKATC